MFFRSATLASATAAVFLACASIAEATPSAALGGHKSHSRLSHQRRKASETVTPTAPGPGDSFKQGSTCTTEWTSTTNSSWKDFKIDFMTGANQAMVKLATIAEDIDGTDSSVTSFSWTCPEVSPYSAIYFYQYTTKDGSDPQWTTRFTITDSSGSSTTPTNSTTSDGETIEWGTGKLISSVSPSEGASSSSSTTSSDSTDASTSSTSTSSPSSTSSNSTSTSTGSTSGSTTSDDDDDSDDAASTTKSASTSNSTSSTSSANKSNTTSSTTNSSTSGASIALAPAQVVAALALVAGAAASLL